MGNGLFYNFWSYRVLVCIGNFPIMHKLNQNQMLGVNYSKFQNSIYFLLPVQADGVSFEDTQMQIEINVLPNDTTIMF